MNALANLSTPMKALATRSQPSTPAAQTTPQPATPTTGTWQHPRLQEIARRQNATTFSKKNLNAVIWNTASLVGCFVLEKVAHSRFPSLMNLVDDLPYTSYIYATIRLLFIVNILFAISPLLRPKDTLSDIPLTPAQRSLLGLPPSAGPPTPGSTYATPPRYSRSPATRSVSNTPIANSPLGGSPLGGSPLNGSPMNFSASFNSSIGGGTPSKGGRESPFSPNTASPLLHKTFSNQRRDSGQSLFGRMADPGTPSPGSAKASVALNNKWLYEKGRSSQGAGGRLFRD